MTFLSHFSSLHFVNLVLLFLFTGEGRPILSNMSKRIQLTERPYIEDVLDKYSSIEGLIALALGSSHWQPPDEALNRLSSNILERTTQRYGSIEGFEPLKQELIRDLQMRGLEMDGMELAITSGANQAFLNVALTLCDENDDVGKLLYNCLLP